MGKRDTLMKWPVKTFNTLTLCLMGVKNTHLVSTFWQDMRTNTHVSKHNWRAISVLGHLNLFAFMCLYVSVCIFVFVWCRERGSSCRSQGPPGLWKTSDPAGRLRGRSGCVDSFLRHMREQEWLCLSSPAYVDVSEDGKTHHISFVCN